MDCPGISELRALAEARLEPARVVPVVQHLLTCGRCRAIAFPDAAGVIADTEPARGGPAASLNDLAVTEEAPGRYQLVRELGRGGQAKVFVAFDHHLGREVAMKVPHLSPTGSAEQQAQTVLRFLREARITARLEHPNIVPIHEIGRRADGSYYCTQRLIRPSQDAAKVRTLRAALSEARTAADRLLLLPNFVAVCNAVAHAHSRGVLHRDLKPDNVVIGALGETVVLDWGLGRLQSDPSEPGTPPPQSDDGVVSLIGAVMGTPSYMSPEQAVGAHASLDERSDVWSLGAMLYELLCGAPPFLGPSAQAVVTQVKTLPVRPVLSQAPDAPRALAAVAMQALERDPARRYASAQALASDVSAWLTDLPVRAYHYSLIEQLRLFAARHKTATGVALIALVLLGLASAGMLRSYLRARSALAEVFVSRARVAEERLEWDAAAAYYAAARASEDRADARLGSMLAANRAEISVRRLEGHSGSVFALARSPDGRMLASGSFDRTARLWDVATGKAARILIGHHKTVTAVAFSPDGRWLATASEDRTARLWDLDAGTAGEVVATSSAAFNAVAFSRDSQRLALGGEDRRVWMVALADRAVSMSDAFDGGPGSHHGPIYGVAFLPDGALVSTGWDKATRLWSTDGGLSTVRELKDHKDSVLSVRVSPNGKELATSSRDGTVLLYEFDNLDAPIVLEGHEQKVYSVDFSPDSQVLGSAGTDRSVRLWLAGAYPKVYGGPNWRSQVSASYRGDFEVNAVAFVDSTLIASGGNGGDIFLRRFEAIPNQPSLQRIDSIAPMPRSGRLAHPEPGGFALRPLADFDRSLIEVHPLGRPFQSGALAVSPDEKTLIGRCQQTRICWLDLASLEVIGSAEFPDGGEIVSSAFSGDGRWVAVTMQNGAVSIFDARTRVLVTILPLDPTGVFGADFSPDSTLLATASYDKQIRLWDTSTWQLVRALEGHEHGIRRVAFSPDGKLLASASWDRTVRLWDPRTGRQLGVMRGHLDQVCAVAFSPDGKMIASGGWDGTVRLWSVETFEELASFVSDEGRVWSIAFAPDGKSLFYGGLRLHRLEFKPLASPEEALKRALEAGGYRLEGPRLVR